MDELLARLRAAERRLHALRRATPSVETDAFTVDLGAASASAPPRVTCDLTPTEWHLVEILVRNPGKLVSQRQLLQEVWGPQYQDETNYLRVYMAQIRRKLEPDPAEPRYFITEPGMGYRFEPRVRTMRKTVAGYVVAVVATAALVVVLHPHRDDINTVSEGVRVPVRGRGHRVARRARGPASWPRSWGSRASTTSSSRRSTRSRSARARTS